MPSIAVGSKIGVGFGNKTIPNKSDALVWLDGTISGNNFVDKISGRLFPIANKDFPTGWTKGFPYKSAATFSAPVGDTALIAADVNGFLYTAGVPNQIPVVSCFQDVDYAHRLFFRHIEQSVDIDTYAETYEPRVAEMVLYNTAATGNDLSSRNAYFNVPAEDLSAKWINPNSVELVGARDGSKSHPWKGIIEAEAAAVSGNIYVKTGVISETASILLTKQLNYVSVGLVVVKSNQTTNGLIRVGNSSNSRVISGMILDAQSQVGWVDYFATYKNVTLSKCRFINPQTNLSQGNIRAFQASAPVNNNITQCVFPSGTVANCIFGPIFKITQSYFKLTATTSIIRSVSAYTELKYNRFDTVSGVPLNPFDCGIDSQFNEFNQAAKSRLLIDELSSGHANATKFNYQKVRQADITGAVFIDIKGVNSQCQHNDIVLTGTSVASTDNQTTILQITCSGANNSNNTITSESERIVGYVGVKSGGLARTGNKVNGNVINNKKASGITIFIDGEQSATQHHLLDGFECNNNVINSPVSFGNNYGTGHAYLVWGNNGSFRGNYVDGEKLGFVFKSQGATCSIDTSKINGVPNIAKNCGVSLTIKGTSGLTLEDFECESSDSGVDSPNMIVIINNVSFKSKNNTIKNGKFIYRGTRLTYRMYYLDDVENLTGLVLSGNTYSTTNPNGFAQVGSTVYSFDQWCALTGDNGILI